MQIQRSPLVAFVYGLASIAPLARAACECGYLDPATNALWTDATITYFNETGLNDVVTNPAVSPGPYGYQTGGSTGNGQEAWAIVGDNINAYEDSFGATYRSAISYNNTYIDDQSQGLSLQVSPVDAKTRIVNGSTIVTRRRDIQYGSFRASIAPPQTDGYGAGFTFGASYNESETVDLSIMSADIANGSTLRWSWSATQQDAKPRYLNYSWLDVNAPAPLEHRFDWLNHQEIQFRNNGDNATIAYGEYVKKVNTTNIPIMPAPISFKAWANGDPTGSQGPPVDAPLVTRVLYTRFFFNSTLEERKEQFVQQCKAATAPVCSTEDYTLRNSTVFSLDALDHFIEAAVPYKPPFFAMIAETCFLGIAILVFAHGIFIRRRQAKEKKAAAAAAALAGASSSKKDDEDAEEDATDYGSKYTGSQVDLIDKMAFKNSPVDSLTDLPDFTHGWDSDSEYDSDEMEDEPTGAIEIADKRKSIRFSIAGKLPMYHAKMDEIASPRATMNRGESFRMNPGSLGLFAPPTQEATDDEPQQDMANKRRSILRRGSILTKKENRKTARMSQFVEPPSHIRPLQLQVEPAIVKWGKRNDGDQVGQLAKPRHSIAVSNRRQSTIFVRDTFVQNIFNKMRNAIFISGPVAKTSIGERRIDYLDGMRGFACLFVSLGHFILMFYPGIANAYAPHHYQGMEYWVRSIFAPIIVDAPLVLGIFFMLPARTVCQRYLMKGGLLSLADSTIRRIPRIAIPVAGACLANYLMMDVNAYKWVPRLPSRTWSTWAYFQNYENVLTFVNAFISLWWATPPASPAMVSGYATGVLWTIPLIVQGMWTCTITALIAHELKTAWKRFTFYFACIGLSYYANTWDMFFMGGLIIADLDANLHYREKAARGVPLVIIPRVRIPGVLLAWIAMLGIGSTMWLSIDLSATLRIMLEEYGIHPNWQTSTPHAWQGDMFSYRDPQVLGFVWIMSLFVLADLSNIFQTFFRLRIWSFLGKNAMAYFLCHGLIFWTWGAWLCIALLRVNTPYWAAILVVFVTSYMWLTLLCICFTATFESWSVLFSKATWRAASGSHFGQK